MKKVMILFVFALALGVSAPQILNASPVQSKISKNMTVSKKQKVKYQQITVKSIPKVVENSFHKAYHGYAIEKSCKGTNGTYRLKVSNKKTVQVLYYKGNGKFIKAVKANPPKKAKPSMNKK